MLIEAFGKFYKVTADYGYVIVDKTKQPLGSSVMCATEEQANSYSEVKREDVYQPKDVVDDLQRQIDELKEIIKTLKGED